MLNWNFLAIWMPSTVEWVVIGIIGILLFGNRLPRIARSIGSTFVEFKRGSREALKELEEMSEDVKKAVKE